MPDYLLDTIGKSGSVVYFIFLVSVYAWFLIAGKYIFLKKEEHSCELMKKAAGGTGGQGTETGDFQADKKRTGLLPSLLNETRTACGGESDEHFADAARTYYYTQLESNIGTLATLASVAPLLGLLGTVIGMMKTFSVIKLFGSANPALMADGISEALLTTQAGLVVAFPIVMAKNYLKNRIREIQDDFERIILGAGRDHNA